MANHILLQKVKLTSSAASVTFANIPQSGYNDLKIVVSGRNNTNPYSETWMQFGIGFNGQGNMVNVTGKGLSGNGTNAGSLNMPADAANITYMPSSGATANTFGNTEFYIANYTSSNNKSFSVDSVTETNATAALGILSAGLWSQTSAITSITLTSRNGSFDTYSTFSLYGVAATGTSPATAPKADGGNTITTDGTYWYHTFTSSGFFTPISSLTCDYLVVAGGGGGGQQFGGGGGAGGLRSTVTATGGGGSLESAISVLADTSYTITVGAGGAGATSNSVNGVSGSNSVFSTITSTGGGGGASSQPESSAGLTGGSGGGGTGNGSGAGGSGTANQGYAGGQGNDPKLRGGGGGGANAVGASGNASGNGGDGVATSISGASVTYAGGGGGGSRGTLSAAGTGGSGGGGNGTSNETAAAAGTTNRGAGGGGGGNVSGGNGGNGGNGGSGIVIIRYAV